MLKTIILLSILLFNMLIIYYLFELKNNIMSITEQPEIDISEIPELKPDENGNYPEIPENKIMKVKDMLQFQFSESNFNV